MLLSEREMTKLQAIVNEVESTKLIDKARRYNDYITWLVSMVNRLSSVNRMIAEEKIELADLRRMKEHVIKFADAIGLNRPAME